MLTRSRFSLEEVSIWTRLNPGPTFKQIMSFPNLKAIAIPIEALPQDWLLLNMEDLFPPCLEVIKIHGLCPGVDVEQAWAHDGFLQRFADAKTLNPVIFTHLRYLELGDEEPPNGDSRATDMAKCFPPQGIV